MGLVRHVGAGGRNRDVVRTAMSVAKYAEQNKTAREDRGEQNKFAALGFEEIEKVARFHG
jgi:hypothetical protein